MGSDHCPIALKIDVPEGDVEETKEEVKVDEKKKETRKSKKN